MDGPDLAELKRERDRLRAGLTRCRGLLADYRCKLAAATRGRPMFDWPDDRRGRQPAQARVSHGPAVRRRTGS